ncbi:MAG TPA: insulinase family protein [Firmicutes bacterium]|nr:insulinase family protein [Bacillota bacterium]
MYNKSTLPGGIRVVTEEIPGLSSVSVGLWVNVGSKYESEAEAGVSHLIEHLLFKGTGRRTAREIAEAIDSVGGQLNAFTSKEYTCYYAKVLGEHLPLALDVLADMFLEPLFAPADIVREKQVVLEEIRMYEDSPDELVHDLLTEVTWPGHPLGRPTLGTKKSLSGLTPEVIRSFYEEHYTPADLVITAAGRLKHAEVAELCRRHFAGFSRPNVPSTQRTPLFQPGRRVFTRNTEQVHVCLGAPGVAAEDESNYVVEVTNSILGGGLSSRLFQHIREEKGLAYSVYSYHTAYQGVGLFTVYMGLSAANLRAGLAMAGEELQKLLQEGVPEEDVQRARQQVLGSFLLSLENSTNRMIRLGKQELSLGRYIPVEEVETKLRSVTAQDVKCLAARAFNAEQLTTVILGPVDGGELD